VKKNSMDKKYIGTIVEESLKDNLIINDLKILSVRISRDDNPADRWHMYQVEMTDEQIEKMAEVIKENGWYMHFWDSEKNIIAVFSHRIFRFNFDDKTSWTQAVEYGLSIGISKEQLDFLIES